VTTRRFLLCSTPAQGHIAPLLPIARRLVDDGHEVVLFTTEHYRDKVVSTGARFVPFAPACDAHDLMVANPDREGASTRGIRGLKNDLRHIFIEPMSGQLAGIADILSGFAADVVIFDSMFLGALALGFRRQTPSPGLVSIGVTPLALTSGDTAPFGLGLQPGSGAAYRARNAALNWTTQHIVLRDIGRLVRQRLVEFGAPPLPSYFVDYFVDLPPKVVDAYLQTTVVGFEYPRRDLPTSVRFVGPILPPAPEEYDRPEWWDELQSARPVVHVTQGTLDNADLGRLLLPTIRALAGDDVLVVATTGGPDPDPLRPSLPPNVRLERFIPHALLLPHTDVMVTNGGYGGVQQALAYGVPLVVAGDSEDKPEVAARVRWSGAGIDLRTGRPTPEKLAAAVRRILTQPRFKTHARSLQSEIRVSHPLDTIADIVVTLAAEGGAGRH
jgi:UDP:flavonoid glycosyltransferase YjiC (YdhE family)